MNVPDLCATLVVSPWYVLSDEQGKKIRVPDDEVRRLRLMPTPLLVRSFSDIMPYASRCEQFSVIVHPVSSRDFLHEYPVACVQTEIKDVQHRKHSDMASEIFVGKADYRPAHATDEEAYGIILNGLRECAKTYQKKGHYVFTYKQDRILIDNKASTIRVSGFKQNITLFPLTEDILRTIPQTKQPLEERIL